MDNEILFLQNLAVARTYPESLMHRDEPRTALRACREHYESNKIKMFGGASSRIEQPPLIIIDFDDDAAPEGDEVSKKAKLHIIRDVAGLRGILSSWPGLSEVGKTPRDLARDPGLRIVRLERMSPTSLLLNLSERLLLELLTYHQVPPHFLNFLASGGESWSFASSMRFAGFLGTTSLGSSHCPGIASLGRSGRHIQLCLSLFSTREYPLHALPRGVDPHKTPRWETHSAAVYLHFDVVEGTAVWFIASPRNYHPVQGTGIHNPVWNAVKETAERTLERKTESSDAPGRFRMSLDSLLAVAEWSIEELSPYLQDLEMRLSNLTKPYLYPLEDDEYDEAEPHETIHEQDLRMMAFLMEQRHESVMKADNNLRVLRRLLRFFVDEVSGSLTSLGSGDAEQMRTHIEEFRDELSQVMEEMEDLIDRAQALGKLAGNREEYIQRMQTHHASQQMKSIAEFTADDSSVMKQLSFIALILLPVTVVSTVLSTDIVKFQDISNENESSGAGAAGGRRPEAPAPVYTFSVAAFATWAVASVVLTIVTLVIVKPMGGRRSRGRDVGCSSASSHTSFRLIPWKRQFLKPWKVRGTSHSAEEEATVFAPSPTVRSIHAAPTVSKTTWQSQREDAVMGEGDPMQAGASQTLTSMERWSWGTLWRRRSTMERAPASATATAASVLPR